MNARTLSYKLARHCEERGCEVVEGPLKKSSPEGVTWEFIVFNDRNASERDPLGVVVVYANLDVRVIADDANGQRVLSRLLQEVK